MQLSPRYDGPQILTLDGPVDGQAAPVARQRRRFEAVLNELSEDDWVAPSRCDGWTVQDVVSHLVGVNGFWELAVRSGLAGAPTRLLGGFDPAATPPVMVAGMRSMRPAEVLAQFVASNDGFLGALDGLDAAGWAATAEAPPGHVPVHVLAQHALWDSWIHERDVVLPLGGAPVCEDDEVRSCLRYAAAISPALGLALGSSARGEFAVDAAGPQVRFVVDVDASVAVRQATVHEVDERPCLRGDAVVLVEALSLRVPLPADAPAAWQALLTGLATAFDSPI